MDGEIGVYLHVPFCLSKCDYCDFDSVSLETAGGPRVARRYVDALGVELDLRWGSEEFQGARVGSVYLGGGTPTVLPADWLVELIARLRRRFEVAPEAEVTVEANPGTVAVEKVTALLQGGVNRVSLGVQSFSDKALRTLGRAHTAAEASAAVAAVRKAGGVNLGLDLIYGVPQMSLEEWEASLRQALALDVEHISAYGLSVEAGTPLQHRIATGELPAPDDEMCARMYALADDMLSGAGYHHYEISNFAQPGRECQHNRGYWAGGEYLGLGCSAHSHRGGLRWNNSPGPLVYIERLERGQLPVAQAEALSARRRLGEALMLGLRRAEGVAEEELTARCGLSPREAFEEEIDQLCEQELLVAEGGRLRIPRGKWLVSNAVLSHFAG